MDQDSIENVLADLSLGPVRYFDRIGSTNDEAALWAEAGAPDMALVISNEQTSGRGRLNRQWYTPPDAALAFSLVLRQAQTEGTNSWQYSRSQLPHSKLPFLTALGALAVSDALIDLYTLTAQIKWPNDVVVERRKLAGVLTEAHWQGEQLTAAILGVGINIAPSSVPPPGELNFPATCVQACLENPNAPDRKVDRLVLLHATLKNLLDWRPRLASPEFLSAWEARLAFRREWVMMHGQVTEQAIDVEKKPLEGQVLGLASDGRLRLHTRSGNECHLQSGELGLRPVDSSIKSTKL